MVSFSKAQSHLYLAKSGTTNYEILISESASTNELKAAEVLKKYFYNVAGVALQITTKITKEKSYFSIGKTPLNHRYLQHDEFQIFNKENNIIFLGDRQKSVLYGVYHFIETFLKCRKWAPNEPAECPKIKNLQIDILINIQEKPSFDYREVYSTAEQDQEYMDWYKLHNLEELWGLWGHSYYKLVPTSLFKTHPEYFAFFDGKRRPNQLCLSNDSVLEITIKSLEEKFKEHPESIYWSISPNDDIGHCECDLCRTTNEEEGGAQGSLIKFLNKIAKRFPDKIFTTLAYGDTKNPTLKTKPLPNVIIFLSSIDIYRNNPIPTEKTAAGFRNNLEGWLRQTPNVFVWDYYTQFTNYLAPFPDVLNIGQNINYFKTKKVKGVFAQMGGSAYVDFNQLKTYLLAKKLWNHNLDDEKLLDEFLTGYYGKSSHLIKEFLQKIHNYSISSGSKLDIYGNPVNEHKSFLTPENMNEFSLLFDEAERVAENKKIIKRIQDLRLAFDYTYLQQSRFYGREKHGLFEKNYDNQWVVKEPLKEKVRRFIAAAKRAGVTEISEDGKTLEDYRKEWLNIFKIGVPENVAINADVKINVPWLPEFSAKKEQTLVDGMYGFNDFSYNWLLFDKPVTVTLDLREQKKITSITPEFLNDQRHWIFLPQTVIVSVSIDGENYKKLPQNNLDISEQNAVETKKITFSPNENVRFIKLDIIPPASLPEWRNRLNKKPLIAIDEIWVK